MKYLYQDEYLEVASQRVGDSGNHLIHLTACQACPAGLAAPGSMIPHPISTTAEFSCGSLQQQIRAIHGRPDMHGTQEDGHVRQRLYASRVVVVLTETAAQVLSIQI